MLLPWLDNLLNDYVDRYSEGKQEELKEGTFVQFLFLGKSVTVSSSMIGSTENKLKATSKDFKQFVSFYVFVLLGIYSEEKNVYKDMYGGCICMHVHRYRNAVHRFDFKDGIINFVVYFIFKDSTLYRTLVITK